MEEAAARCSATTRPPGANPEDGLMPEIAKRVVLDLAQSKLFVDDVEFPWVITKDGGVQIQGGADYMCTATVTFMADAIEVVPLPENPQEGLGKQLVV